MMAILLLALSLAQGAPAAPDDAAAAAAIETFNKSWSSHKGDQRAGDVALLATTIHDKVAAKLASLLTHEDRPVRLAAVGGLQTFTTTPELRKVASKALTGAINSGVNFSDTEVKIAILTALGALNDELSWSKVKDLFEEKELKVASAAITAAGQIKTKNMIEPLITLLRDLEQEQKKGQPAAPPQASPTGKKIPMKARPSDTPVVSEEDRKKKERANALLPLAQSALCNLTGQGSLKTSTEWENWWSKNRSNFKP